MQNLRESIVVVDHENRIRLINESAAQLLGDTGPFRAHCWARLHLRCICSKPGASTAPPLPSQTFVAADGGRVIQPHFAPLGGAEPLPVIVFLEDTELLAAKIQQSKLADLGRLSASIAHNPQSRRRHEHARSCWRSRPRFRTKTSV